MEDLISRSALIAWENNFCADCTRDQEHCSNCIMNDVIKKIKDTPAVDAELVRHGHWIEAPQELQRAEELENGNKLYFCSICDAGDLHAVTQDVPYCWKCGARMDGREKAKND